MMVNRLPEKKPQFQKIRKLQNLIHFNEQGISCIEVFLSQTLMILQNAARGWNSLGHWRLNLWAAEWGIYYSNVYRKISFAPLNILASVCSLK